MSERRVSRLALRAMLSGSRPRYVYGVDFETIAKRTSASCGAVLDVDVRVRAAAVGAEERVERGGDVQRVRREPLDPAGVPLDPPDHRRVEADAGAEQERPVVGHADADPPERSAIERVEERPRGVVGARAG